MYCTNCGHKLKDSSNFCTNCGKKIIKNNSHDKNNSLNSLSLIIGIISIIGSIIINIFILPLAIFGIIISFKQPKKTALILNIISCLIAIIIFIIASFFIYKAFNTTKEIYDNKYNDDNKYDYHDNYYNKIDLTGTWYLYTNNQLNQDTYYKFNSNQTFTYIIDKNTYTGTYSIDENNFYNTEELNNYLLTLNIISIMKNDGTIETDNLEKISYEIKVNNNILELRNIKTNEYLTLKKDISVTY